MTATIQDIPLGFFHDCTRDWFARNFDAPTPVQTRAWPVIARGESTLLLAPTGSGKTLAAFLAAIDRLFFDDITETADARPACIKVVYVSPLKALGADVDRNLRGPLAGLREYAERHEIPHRLPRVAVRSGDTTQRERAEVVRRPPDILITTPESLYLMLTSNAESVLTAVDTVIVDEIHALAGTKRGSHLFSTLERLERLRNRSKQDNAARLRPLQRVGLSATQRPLEEIATLLGGGIATADPEAPAKTRPVTIIDASAKRRFDLTIETPAEELFNSKSSTEKEVDETTVPTVWPSIHSRLVELIRQNRSTMIFVNSRRLAERLANAINEVAEEELALAHHGSVAKETRAYIEERLKQGELPAIVATSSMELGIDMGAIDLVIQIEAPPSIASGTQRIGRAGHQVGAVSTGVIFPKFRGDLIASTAAAEAMQAGWVEETRFPRNPLDILAQQIVAITSREEISFDALYATLRGAAPFFELPHSSFVGVLDLLSGRFPSDEFSELRPRINWDRTTGIISPRQGAQRLAVLNGGTIPDRGLYGVYLIGDDGGAGGRIGELDEEMVFESRPGDIFLLGASSWRVMEITRDRVLVVPAPGEPGRMPFWRGDGPGRLREFGQAIGRLSRELLELPEQRAIARLTKEYGLQKIAAESLLGYLNDQVEATSEIPSDKSIVVERFLDEVGDWRIVILSPFGSRVHAPWAMLVAARLRQETGTEIDVNWTDDGIVFRLPNAHDIPPRELFFPRPNDVEEELVREIGNTALFAAKFRENAARSLLLPRRSPSRRTPLWLQRRRAGDLLKVAARFRGFPILMETYRECLRDVFDMDGFLSLLHDVTTGTVRVHSVRTDHPSPFAAAVLFSYAGNFLYNGDAPLAERRAQTLSLDHVQLRELLGTVDLRELLDPRAIEEVCRQLQQLDRFKLRHADDLHGMLLNLGAMTRMQIAQRCTPEDVAVERHLDWIESLQRSNRVFGFDISSEQRFAAAEDAGRLRDALGIVPPANLAEVFLEPAQEPVVDLVSQYARTHGPFTEEEAAARCGMGVATTVAALSLLEERGRVVQGEFLPGRQGREWCDNNVLRQIKRRSLAALREEVEPVEPETLARFLPAWHGITRPRRGMDGILDAVEQLQGAPLPASTLENEILPARVRDFRIGDFDELCLQREIIWRGFDRTGSQDGRIGLFLTDEYASLAPHTLSLEDAIAIQVRDLLEHRGGLFFDQIAAELRQFPNDLLKVLWEQVWRGELTNDTLTPLRSLRTSAANRHQTERRSSHGFRSRRKNRLSGSEGRWSLLPRLDGSSSPSVTERQTAIAAQLIERHGVLTKEMLSREEVAGGFAGLYPVLKAMEEAGRVRRGYFVAGLGAAQFASPGAEDQLRSFRSLTEGAEHTIVLAATDPANPWGNALPWPETPDTARPQRVADAKVVIVNGRLAGYLNRTRENLITFLTEFPGDRRQYAKAVAFALADMASPGRTVLLAKVDGVPPQESVMSDALKSAGFHCTTRGFLWRASN